MLQLPLRLLSATLLAILINGAASAAPSIDAVVGTWTGRYTCLQGIVKLDLAVSRADGGSLKALFNFSPPPENPGIPSGSYEMSGTYTPTSGTLQLTPVRWITQPPGYVMVGLAGQVTSNGSVLSYNGAVYGPGCTTFNVSKEDGGSCPTTASVSAEAAECSCGDERDDIIAEYKKSYGTRGSGNPLRIFDVNIDRYGNNPTSYFVPSCNMFTRQLRTAHYTFAQLKNGDGQCLPLHSWALIANALADTTESGRGLDKWVDEILKDTVIITKKTPKLNSAYRSPARQINCLKSGAYGSRHVFGDAVDLDVTGPNDAARRRIALRWYKLAKDMASGDWFEDDSQNYQCSTALPVGKRWECAHVDWRNERDRFRPSAPSSKAAGIGMAALAATLSLANPVSSADKSMVNTIRTLAASKKWEDRSRVLDILALDANERDENNMPIIAGAQVVSRDEKEILLELLRKELSPDFRNGGEEEGEYFYELMVTASLYARPEATALLLSPGVLPRGRAAWRAAARMGDGGVPLLLEKLKNYKDELYSDYVGVACMMHQLNTVKDPSNIRKLDIAIANGTKDPDHSTRYLAADCLKWVPKEISEPILSKLSFKDAHSSVRQVAAKSLAIVKSGKTLDELREDE